MTWWNGLKRAARIAGIVFLVGGCGYQWWLTKGPGAAEPKGDRAYKTCFWFWDSLGVLLTDDEDYASNSTVLVYLSQASGDVDTVEATFETVLPGITRWCLLDKPDTTNIFTAYFRSDQHEYVLADSLLVLGWYVPPASIHDQAFLAAAVPESALQESIICPRHMADSAFTITLTDSSTVPLDALPETLLLESEYREWWGAVGRDTIPVFGINAEFDTATVTALAASGSAIEVIDSVHVAKALAESLYATLAIPETLHVGDRVTVGGTQWDDGSGGINAAAIDLGASAKWLVGNGIGEATAQTFGGSHYAQSDGKVYHVEDGVNTDDIKDANTPAEGDLATYTSSKQINWETPEERKLLEWPALGTIHSDTLCLSDNDGSHSRVAWYVPGMASSRLVLSVSWCQCPNDLFRYHPLIVSGKEPEGFNWWAKTDSIVMTATVGGAWAANQCSCAVVWTVQTQ